MEVVYKDKALKILSFGKKRAKNNPEQNIQAN